MNPAIEEYYGFDDLEGYEEFLGIFGKKHKAKRKMLAKKILGSLKRVNASTPSSNRSVAPTIEKKDNTKTYLIGGAVALLILFFVVK